MWKTEAVVEGVHYAGRRFASAYCLLPSAYRQGTFPPNCPFVTLASPKWR